MDMKACPLGSIRRQIMRYINLQDINFFQIRLFITLSECLNFTKAAELCNVTQPTMSRTITALENTLGIQLFIRDTSRVILTPSGKSLYSDFKTLFVKIDNIIEKTHEIQTGYLNILNIVVSDFINPNFWLYPCISAFKKIQPDIKIDILCPSMQEAEKLLADYEIDAIFNVEYQEACFSKSHEYSNTKIMDNPLVAAMLKSNHLSSKKAITLSELKNQELIMPCFNFSPEFEAYILRLFKNESITPLISSYARDANELIFKLNNDNVFIADKYCKERTNPDLYTADIENSSNNVYFKYRKNDRKSHSSELFSEFVINYFQNYGMS
jgi:DNA-binding transcriptional LysR family regulator